MISTSLKSPRQLLVYPPIWIPDPIQWDNYPTAITSSGLLLYTGNTLQIAVLSVVGSLLSNTVAAYGFARLRWRGRDALFALALATIMLPGAVTLIPLYITFRQLDWLNTYLPLIVPTFFGNAFYLFLLRQFLMTIPQELSDAARIDGCSDLGILRRILLPLMKPALAVVALFEFIHHWNDIVGPLIYLSDKEKYTIALGIATMRADYGMSNFAWIMAAATLSVIPIVVLFFFAQRTFIQGITLTGLKG
jgi:multiple sugar transport system permease protein